MITWIFLWWLVGFVSGITMVVIFDKKIQVDDAAISLILGLLGLVMTVILLVALYGNKVIWRAKDD